MPTNKRGEKVTERDWYLVDVAVRAFMSKYPLEMLAFERQILADRTKYNLATKEHKDLRQASWRNVAAFPVVYKPDGGDDSLLPALNRLLPGLTTQKDLLHKFLRRYPVFQVPSKI